MSDSKPTRLEKIELIQCLSAESIRLGIFQTRINEALTFITFDLDAAVPGGKAVLQRLAEGIADFESVLALADARL